MDNHTSSLMTSLSQQGRVIDMHLRFSSCHFRNDAASKLKTVFEISRKFASRTVFILDCLGTSDKDVGKMAWKTSEEIFYAMLTLAARRLFREWNFLKFLQRPAPIRLLTLSESFTVFEKTSHYINDQLATRKKYIGSASYISWIRLLEKKYKYFVIVANIFVEQHNCDMQKVYE